MASTSEPSAGPPKTVKQQREAKRAEKVAAFKRDQARRARNRRFGIWGGIGGGIVAVGAIVLLVIVTTVPSGPIVINGLQTYANEAGHVTGTVDYPQSPPAGGPHAAAWLNCGVYDREVPKENAVHALEHGAVWVTYDPALADADLQALRAALPSSYIVLSPYPGLDAPVVLSAWDAQVKLDGVDDPRLQDFIKVYWKSPNAPEPGAACSGQLDAPGRIA